MADLDDFFSKRDKKKKSKKDEQFVVDDIAKILDAKTKERKNMETNKSSYVHLASDNEVLSEYKAQTQEGGDDEWKEQVDNTPDYTGLKIQELILEDEVEEETKETAAEEEAIKEGPWSGVKRKQQKQKDKESSAQESLQSSESKLTEESKSEPSPPTPGDSEEGTKTVVQDGTEIEVDPFQSETSESIPSGPEPKKYVPPHERNKQKEVGSPAPAATPTPAPASGEPAPALTSSSSGAYVPPSKRGLSGPSSSLSSKPRKPLVTPKITDEELFPTLEQALNKS